MTIPKKPRWAEAQAAADKFTNNFSAPPIPVLEIAEQNGVDVVFADFGKHKDAVAGFCDFGASKLYVNSDDQPTRQFFTIAHELGHWVMHKDIFEAHPEKYPVLPRFTVPDKDNPLEQEANCFAANLLVPKSLLIPVKSAPTAALAQIFNVSRTMMEFRLKNV